MKDIKTIDQRIREKARAELKEKLGIASREFKKAIEVLGTTDKIKVKGFYLNDSDKKVDFEIDAYNTDVIGEIVSQAFEKLCEDARSRVREITVGEVKRRLDAGEKFLFIDVREDREWEQDHAAGAEHLGRGIIERDIEKTAPDKDAEIVLYCGGGFRSALAADNLQKMGYTNVLSMAGGIRAWREADYPME